MDEERKTGTSIEDVLDEKTRAEAEAMLKKNTEAVTERGNRLADEIAAEMLDPTSREALNKELQAANALFENGEIDRQLNDAAQHHYFTTGDATLSVEEINRIIDTAIKRAAGGLSEVTQKVLEATGDIIKEFWENNAEAIVTITERYEDLKSLEPFIEEELQAAIKEDDALAQYTAHELLREYVLISGELSKDTPPQLRPILERAMQKWTESNGERKSDLPRIISKPTNMIEYPITKVDKVIWDMVETAIGNGQIQMKIDTSKKGSGKEAYILFALDFDELATEGVKITKQLNQFDKRCYIAAAALFNGGNPIISTTQIYKMMGNNGQPSPKDIEKINESLTKMGAARIYIDNGKEVATSKGYAIFKYDASLLPFEREAAYINNTFTEGAIHLFREPPLISFAKQRKQVSTITQPLLASPISKTEDNLRLDNYLIERISHMKSGKGTAPRKMKYATIYENCNIKTTKQKQRAPEKIRRYLDHYKKEQWIKGYTEEQDGITIHL